MLSPHVISNRIRVRESLAAFRDGAQGAIFGVMFVNVSPGHADGRKNAIAQRTFVLDGRWRHSRRPLGVIGVSRGAATSSAAGICNAKVSLHYRCILFFFLFINYDYSTQE